MCPDCRNFTALQKLHKECQENDKVLVAAMGDDTEIVIAPVNCQGGNSVAALIWISKQGQSAA